MPSFRDQFPLLASNLDLCYLDSAATSQKPQAVIDAIAHFYQARNAPVHRGMYPLSLASTNAYEEARATVARFIGGRPEELVFTRGATESLNLLAATLSQSWPAGSNVIISEAEHHANFLPWQQLARAGLVELRLAKITKTGEIDLAHVSELLDRQTVAVSLTHCSNVTGSITPLRQVRELLTKRGSWAVLIADSSQAVPHFSVDVTELGCDFLVFSGHKLYGPAGIGALWGRHELLEALPPYQTGGEMIRSVTLQETTWNDAPWKFEAGTPNAEGAVGLAVAIQWLEGIGMGRVAEHTAAVSGYARKSLEKTKGSTIIGNPDPKSGILSFTVDGIHPHDLAHLLGEQGICIRAGQHCAAPLHQSLGLAASNRISVGIYTDTEDIDRCVAAINEIQAEVANA